MSVSCDYAGGVSFHPAQRLREKGPLVSVSQLRIYDCQQGQALPTHPWQAEGRGRTRTRGSRLGSARRPGFEHYEAASAGQAQASATCPLPATGTLQNEVPRVRRSRRLDRGCRQGAVGAPITLAGPSQAGSPALRTLSSVGGRPPGRAPPQACVPTVSSRLECSRKSPSGANVASPRPGHLLAF